MDFADLVPMVLPDVAGCPSTTIERALRDAATTLCERAGVWVYQMDPVQPASDGVVDLELPTGSRLVTVLSVVADGRSLIGVHRDDADRSPRAIGYARINSEQLQVLNTTPTSVTVRIAVAPDMEAESIPDEVGRLWWTAMVNGAKASLLMIQNVVWSNPQLADYYRRLFASDLVRAAVYTSKDGGSAARRVQPRPIC